MSDLTNIFLKKIVSVIKWKKYRIHFRQGLINTKLTNEQPRKSIEMKTLIQMVGGAIAI